MYVSADNMLLEVEQPIQYPSFLFFSHYVSIYRPRLPFTHFRAVQEVIGKAGGDPLPLQHTTLFNNANDEPEAIISKVAGMQLVGKREDDGPYFTNNEGFQIPHIVKLLAGCLELMIYFCYRNSNTSIEARTWRVSGPILIA
jgi:hypothetical protein